MLLSSRRGAVTTVTSDPGFREACEGQQDASEKGEHHATTLQRPLFMHRKFRPLHHGGSHHEP